MNVKEGDTLIFIDDMEMPENCAKCPFSDGEFTGGAMALRCVTSTGRLMYAPDLIGRADRPEWCPLRDAVNCCEVTDVRDGSKTFFYSRASEEKKEKI